jgi:phage-related protein
LRRHRSIAIISQALVHPRRQLHFVGSSRRDLKALPDHVQDLFGRALLDVQFGDTPTSARAFGEGVSGVMKLIEDDDGQTFRAAYTVEFAGSVYVLHVFTKKSKHGIATPQRDIDLVRARLRRAREHYRSQNETAGR